MPKLQTLFARDTIAQRVRDLGHEIRARYEPDHPLLCVGVLRGAFIFMADLVRAIPGPVECDFVAAESYQGTESTGTVSLTVAPRLDLTGRDVIVVEDIVDTGRTLRALCAHLRAANPRSLAVACLLDKPSRRLVEIVPDWVGFEIEDHFVVGYGLDLDGRYRTLPDVAVIG